MKKKCNTCGIKKTLDNFYKSTNKYHKMGVMNRCKICGKKKELEYSKKRYYKEKDTIKYKYRKYKTGAKQRGINFELDYQEFKKNYNGKCIYCGELTNKRGIDRMNNDLGYTNSNVVSCCSICNMAKRGMSVNDFIRHCRKIVKNYKLLDR